MPYTTASEVRTNSGFTDTALVANTVVDSKIAYADGLINAKIAGVYALPLAVGGVAATPAIIGMLSLEMATVLLLMAQYTEQAQDTDKGWEKRLKVVQDTLDDISKLKSKLFNDAGVEFDRTSTGSPGYYPSRASEAADASPNTARKFEINKTF